MRGQRGSTIGRAGRIVAGAARRVASRGSIDLSPDRGGRTTLQRRPGSTHVVLRHASPLVWGTSWEIELPLGRRRSGMTRIDDHEIAECLREAAAALSRSERRDHRPDHQQRIAEKAAPYCTHLGPDVLVVVAAFGPRPAEGRLASGAMLPEIVRGMIAECGQALRASVSITRRGPWPQGFHNALRIDLIEGSASTAVDPMVVMRRLAGSEAHDAPRDGEPGMGPSPGWAPHGKGN